MGTVVLKPGLRIEDLQKKLFSPQKNMVVEFFSGSDEPLKVAKNTLIRFWWVILFCSSEEPPATNAWVQFRVITSFKLLHRKGFSSANVPEVTQKLALLVYMII